MRAYTRVPLIDRVMAKVVEQDGHWIWTGATGSSGYGHVASGGRHGGMVSVHRTVWEHHNGPIPEGLVLDHLDDCLIITCCSPDHLEPVTQAENRRRQSARRLTCAQGHSYTDVNTRVGKNGRECRICAADRERARRRRNRPAPCPGHARHWFAYYRWPGSSSPVCRRCGAKNPTYVRDRDPFPDTSMARQ